MPAVVLCARCVCDTLSSRSAISFDRSQGNLKGLTVTVWSGNGLITDQTSLGCVQGPSVGLPFLRFLCFAFFAFVLSFMKRCSWKSNATGWVLNVQQELSK